MIPPAYEHVHLLVQFLDPLVVRQGHPHLPDKGPRDTGLFAESCSRSGVRVGTGSLTTPSVGDSAWALTRPCLPCLASGA